MPSNSNEVSATTKTVETKTVEGADKNPRPSYTPLDYTATIAMNALGLGSFNPTLAASSPVGAPLAEATVAPTAAPAATPAPILTVDTTKRDSVASITSVHTASENLTDVDTDIDSDLSPSKADDDTPASLAGTPASMRGVGGIFAVGPDGKHFFAEAGPAAAAAQTPKVAAPSTPTPAGTPFVTLASAALGQSRSR